MLKYVIKDSKGDLVFETAVFDTIHEAIEALNALLISNMDHDYNIETIEVSGAV